MLQKQSGVRCRGLSPPHSKASTRQGHLCHLAAWTPRAGARGRAAGARLGEVGQWGGWLPGTPHPRWDPPLGASPLPITSSPMGSQQPQGAFHLRQSCSNIPKSNLPAPAPSLVASPALHPTVWPGGEVCPVASAPQGKLNKVMGWRANPHLPTHIPPSGPWCMPGHGQLLAWLLARPRLVPVATLSLGAQGGRRGFARAAGVHVPMGGCGRQSTCPGVLWWVRVQGHAAG